MTIALVEAGTEVVNQYGVYGVVALFVGFLIKIAGPGIDALRKNAAALTGLTHMIQEEREEAKEQTRILRELRDNARDVGPKLDAANEKLDHLMKKAVQQ